MNKTITFAVALLAATVGAGSAIAVSQLQATGKILHINPNKHHMSVGHHTYRYDPKLVKVTHKRGESVRIYYTLSDGQRVIQKILPIAH